VSDHGGVQDLAQEQLVKETKKKSHPNQIQWPLKAPVYTYTMNKTGRGLELPAIGKNLFIDLQRKSPEN
jgi:hypothetical protein